MGFSLLPLPKGIRSSLHLEGPCFLPLVHFLPVLSGLSKTCSSASQNLFSFVWPPCFKLQHDQHTVKCPYPKCQFDAFLKFIKVYVHLCNQLNQDTECLHLPRPRWGPHACPLSVSPSRPPSRASQDYNHYPQRLVLPMLELHVNGVI